MTRINVIPVEELSDNFLMAEYFELPRLYPLIIKAALRKDREIPEHYVMGEGHMRFFYDKLTYLIKRHNQLQLEGIKRQLKLAIDPTVQMPTELTLRNLNSFYWADYKPTPEAIQLNRDRLALRHRTVGGVYT